LLAEGDEVRSRDPKAARQWYDRAGRLDPASGAPDFARGRLLFEQDKLLEAQPFLQAAVAKAPDEAEYAATLDRVVQALSETAP
jgi:predicted Zn-dependent protease